MFGAELVGGWKAHVPEKRILSLKEPAGGQSVQSGPYRGAGRNVRAPAAHAGGIAAALSVDKTKSEPDSGLTRVRRRTIREGCMVQPGSSEGNHAWLQGYDTDTDIFMWHTSSQN